MEYLLLAETSEMSLSVNMQFVLQDREFATSCRFTAMASERNPECVQSCPHTFEQVDRERVLMLSASKQAYLSAMDL